jgi:hypothetical protein
VTVDFQLPSRFLAYEGDAMKISGSHNQERHFFLFNDCLIYAKKKGSAKYQFKVSIFLSVE